MYNVKFKVFNNESISNRYRFIIVNNNKIILDKYDYYLDINLDNDIYELYIFYNCKCYKYSFIVNKDYLYNIYISNLFFIKINLIDYYYDLPIEKGMIIFGNSN